MPAATPPAAILSLYQQAVRNITRRIEIYEPDGVTPWKGLTGRIYPFPTVDGDSVPGDSDLVDGSVSVSYGDSERRTLDLTLDNRDGTYSPDPYGFWYDKIIKAYRGVYIPSDVEVPPPSILVIEDLGGMNFLNFTNAMRAAGFYNIRYKVTAPVIADTVGYDIIVALSNSNSPTVAAVINAAWAAGKNIFTLGSAITQTSYPTIISTTTAIVANTSVALNKQATTMQAETNSPLMTSYVPPASTNAGYVIATVPAGVKVGAIDGASRITALTFAYNTRKWVHLQIADLTGFDQNPGMLDYMVRTFTWLNPKVAGVTKWEIQVGEFMIDSIDEPRSPRQVTIHGRDYTKKLMNAMFGATTSYPKTNNAEATIQTIAVNGGINPNKIIMPASRQVFGTIQTFERGSTRWEAITKIAEAYNLEVFFDNVGNLVIRAFLDPTTANPIYFFTSGPTVSASLTDWTRQTNDSSLVNQVIVCGESSDSTVVPVSYIANNTNPASPSNQQSLGIRSYYYSSPVITTVAQATALAKKFLAIYALEEFVMNWGSLCFDWLEAGDIVDVNPAAADFRPPNVNTPTRYLLTNFTIPLGLGPMSSTGKRVLVVG